MLSAANKKSLTATSMVSTSSSENFSINSTNNNDFYSVASYTNEETISSKENEGENTIDSIAIIANKSLTNDNSSSRAGLTLICIFLSFTGLIFGWDVGTIGGITNMTSFKNHFGTRIDSITGEKYLPSLLVGGIISIFNIGCAAGGLSLARIGDTYGRKIGIYLALIVYLIGLFIQITSVSGKWYQFFIGRIFTGLGVGSTSVLGPMFISESAPIDIRGRMISMYQVMCTFGILAGNVTNFICVKILLSSATNRQWIIPIAIGILWAFFVFIAVIIAPESPIYLQEKKLKQENTNNKKVFFFNPLKNGNSLYLRLFIGIMIMVFQQTSGVNYFFYYGTSLFDSIGSSDPYLTAIILSAVNFGTTLSGISLVDKLGRKKLLFYGSIGCFISMFVYASVGQFCGGAIHVATIIMILFTCLFIISFAITLGPVSFVVISELFPAHCKNLCMAISTLFNWLFNFLIGFFTPIITSKIGFSFGYVFAAFMLISIFFVFFMVPETKGLTSFQIEEIYSGNRGNCASQQESCKKEISTENDF
ncbi:related to Hexose transporter HXT14 [Saccharomycodes ludwigii]|uniref:Related to Hexose transporter HXT14 n=1 Tax=Saccharomycodes ludwigii TaxID=36035 RepID=A0A376BAW1_9ASCO|nr:hypothetical protein SCDLUD_004835 [Saccharomycodes ludwigii]KAH3899392.1 hypothetical protein SCDLUD_004835 [Saccharomycodes ludwigii]SSD61802.1 related to Hexose transporter HXT14 [Saccharomycodes ludwigii]